MSKFNYSKQFAKKEEKPVETAEVKNEEVVETVVETPAPAEVVKTGVVSGCKKLRVRKGPSKQTNVAAVIDEDKEVIILEELPDWYKVRIAGGIIGYCVAEFITIK